MPFRNWFSMYLSNTGLKLHCWNWFWVKIFLVSHRLHNVQFAQAHVYVYKWCQHKPVLRKEFLIMSSSIASSVCLIAVFVLLVNLLHFSLSSRLIFFCRMNVKIIDADIFASHSFCRVFAIFFLDLITHSWKCV